MRIFFGLFLATTINFFLGITGFYVALYLGILSFSPNNQFNLISFSDYLMSFSLKFLVILILTWIMHRVMTMLDTPKKRVIFIFLLGSCFSIYNQVDIFWSKNSLIWSLILISGESFNWLVTGYVLSKFTKPKHLGAF
tara:strand:+ start:22 stop:435 length:414 start_codon:yes stop_codon:yes gene_type:complete